MEAGAGPLVGGHDLTVEALAELVPGLSRAAILDVVEQVILVTSSPSAVFQGPEWLPGCHATARSARPRSWAARTLTSSCCPLLPVEVR